MNHMNQESHCSCAHHKLGSIIVMLIGLAFLLGNMQVIDPRISGLIWPALLIVWGFVKLMGGSCKCYMRS